MSLVGPRPLPLRDYERLEAWHRKRYLVLPGVTGLWQISGRSNLGFDDLVRLDFFYLENWSIWLDISILVKTIPAVLSRPRRVLRWSACSSPARRVRRPPPARPSSARRSCRSTATCSTRDAVARGRARRRSRRRGRPPRRASRRWPPRGRTPPGRLARERRRHGQRARGGAPRAARGARALRLDGRGLRQRDAASRRPEDEPRRAALAVRRDEGGRRARLRAASGARRRRRARFNHEGPGRDERFAVGSWTRQIARLEAEGGGSAARRRPLRRARPRPTCATSAAPTGCCSTRPSRPAPTTSRRAARVTMAHVVELLVELARVPVQVERDESRAAPGRHPRGSAGDPARLRAATGWEPEIPLEQTLADALDAARASCRAESR